jgi:peptidyl-Asp metalloendopeptidase
MKRTIVFTAIATIAVVGFAAFASQAAKQPLFVSTKAPAGLATDASYLALASDRATASLDVVQADAAQISGASETLQLSVSNQSLVARKQTFTRNPDGTTVWQGRLGADPGLLGALRARFVGDVVEDPNNEVTIVRNGDKLTGTLRIDGQVYALRPLRSGSHAIARIDQSKMPADHPGEYAMLPRIDMPKTLDAKAGQIGAADVRATTYTIRIISMATQSASNASGDLVGLVNLAITETNQSYANSSIYITAQNAGVYITNYVESGSFSTDLTRFRGTTDGFMDNIHTARNTQAADVAMLFINNSSSCGIASGIGSTASAAFAVVHYGCATGYYSFGHEIGHLQSARHDPAADPTNTPYAYGHGYRSPTSLWRTVMAYDCSSGCPRIKYWSYPNLILNGQAMGTATSSNNALVLNNTRATIAAYR